MTYNIYKTYIRIRNHENNVPRPLGYHHNGFVSTHTSNLMCLNV